MKVYIHPQIILNNIKNKAGVYVIVCKTPPFYSVIDCGESAAIIKRLKIMTEKSVGLKSAPEFWCLLFFMLRILSPKIVLPSVKKFEKLIISRVENNCFV